VALSVRALAFLLLLPAPAAAARSPFLPTPPYGGPHEIVLFGHLASLKPSGSHRFTLRFDPAIQLTGKTATAYALEKTGSPDVPNDHVTYDPDHQLLTFAVPAGARVTVITNRHGIGIKATKVSVATLARVVAGQAPASLALFEPPAPFWIVVRTDTVVELDQQYVP